MSKITYNKWNSEEKAFTLIELLAVIVILAIIALISVPLVLNIIAKTRKSAFKSSAYEIMKSAELYYMENIIDNKEIGDKVFSYDSENTELKYKGTRPKGGQIILKSDGKIEMSIHNGEWCAIKNEEDSQIKIIKYNKETCEIDSPMILEGSSIENIAFGLDSVIPGNYYNVKNQKGTITCYNLSDENKEITNTKELKIGENHIKCSMIYENKEIVSLTRVFKVDVMAPTITSDYTSVAYSMSEKANVDVNSLYTVTYGGIEGSTICKNGSTPITNLSILPIGTHELTCTATGDTGKTTNISLKVRVKSPAEEMAEANNLPFVAGGYRYQGGNPNNYVSFNGTLFRIIGVFDGQMKIMLDNFYNPEIAWDRTGGEKGNNNWTRPADLNTKLNSTYWNSISSTYQAMVDQSHVWDIGGADAIHKKRSDYYAFEKNKKWTGKVGLMTVADYGYATNGTSCDGDTSLWNSSYSSTYGQCYQTSNNWLANTSYNQWTIISSCIGDTAVFFVSKDGKPSTIAARLVMNAEVSDCSTCYNYRVRPVVYLKPNIKITGGTGISSNPYILSL